jgi:hypothetical protein
MTSPDDINAALWNGYTAAFNYFNKELFEGKLPICVLTLNAKGASTGFFKSVNWKKGEQDYHEICLNPVLLNRTDDLVFQTLARLMVFLWQHTYGAPNSPGYCDSEYTKKMREIGLPCESEYGLNLRFGVDPKGKYASIRPEAMNNFFPLQNLEIPPPKKTRIQHSCPKCGSKAMGAPGTRLICITEDCQIEMTKRIVQ